MGRRGLYSLCEILPASYVSSKQYQSDMISWCGLECVLLYFVCLLSHFSCTLCVGNSSAAEHATGVCVCGEGTA